MKKLLLSLGIIASAFSINAQTAPNFTANDCAAINHDLYTELNSGKIIVITFIMPCSSCIGGATASQNAVNSFSTSNPGQVLHYVSDDVANTTCATLSNWCATNGINPNAKFATSSVVQSNFGTGGMPKVVVLGNTSHTIYYNTNGSAVNQGNITTAINTALAAATGVNEISSHTFEAKISPNPASSELTLTLTSKGNEELVIEIYNMTGQKVKTIEKTTLAGKNELKIGIDELSTGNYFLKLNNGRSSESMKFIISK